MNTIGLVIFFVFLLFCFFALFLIYRWTSNYLSDHKHSNNDNKNDMAEEGEGAVCSSAHSSYTSLHVVEEDVFSLNNLQLNSSSSNEYKSSNNDDGTMTTVDCNNNDVPGDCRGNFIFQSGSSNSDEYLGDDREDQNGDSNATSPEILSPSHSDRMLHNDGSTHVLDMISDTHNSDNWIQNDTHHIDDDFENEEEELRVTKFYRNEGIRLSNLFDYSFLVKINLKHISSKIMGSIKLLDMWTSPHAFPPLSIRFHIKLLPQNLYKMKTGWEVASTYNPQIMLYFGPLSEDLNPNSKICFRLYGRKVKSVLSRGRCYGECQLALGLITHAEKEILVRQWLLPKGESSAPPV